MSSTNYAWVDLGDGRSVYRNVAPKPRGERSHLPSPMVVCDTLDQPTQSMADGKYYTSKSAMRATYRPSGNPQGNSYIEVGNEVQKQTPYAPIDGAKIDQSLQKALARYQAGERPSSQTGK